MSDILLPAGYGLFVWWASTGLALLAVGRSPERSRPALAGIAILLAASFALLAATRGDPSHAGHYLAFTAAIGIWGAGEIAFLTGWLTGPWRKPSPAGAGPWRHTGCAIAAILWHEIALFAAGAAVIAICSGGANRTGLWSFAILFVMRISAKLNVFLGVPNLTENFLPPHLGYLKSFFGRRPMNGLFPVSVTASTVALVLLTERVGLAEGPAVTGLVFLATLLGLALLEHWFLVLPLPVDAIWAWGLAPEAARGGEGLGDPRPDGAVVVRLEPHLVSRSASLATIGIRPPHPRTGDRRALATRPD